MLIKVDNLSKSYHTKNGIIDSLSDVSFTLNQGDRLALIGLNGSGKSTLLKIIGGLIVPSKGSIQLNGDALYLSQGSSMLQQDLTGNENIDIYLRMYGFGWEEIKAFKHQIIEFSELGDFIEQPIKKYSSGMLLRLSFSISIFINPQILLLDEVFSMGDVSFVKKAQAQIKKKLGETGSIILASHDLNELKSLCNKCIVLKKGKMVYSGEVNDAINFYLSEFNTTQSEGEKNLIEVLSVSTSNLNKNYLYSEEIKINIEYRKLINKRIDIVIYVDMNEEKVLTDCMIYREDYEFSEEPKGLYLASFTIPPFMLNKGLYNLHIKFGDGESHIFILSNALKFSVISDDWEQNNYWNIRPDYYIRPRLKWTKKQIN